MRSFKTSAEQLAYQQGRVDILKEIKNEEKEGSEEYPLGNSLEPYDIMRDSEL